MHPQVSDIFASDDCPSGICVVDGYGIRVGVARKHLVITDGIGRTRRTRRFARADRSLRRVVVIGNSGMITLDALRFLGDIRVPLIQIDCEGRVLAASAVQGTDNPALRRAQALASGNPVGLEIDRSLITDKLQGQLKVARRLQSDLASSVIEVALDDLAKAQKSDEILTAEAVAASMYWPAWWEVPVHFVKADVKQVPNHWLTFGQRRSPLSQSARSAVTPGNALLNYAYSLLVAETRIACLTMGLDPGLGVLHADRANRDSLVADVMEPVRPQVDAFILDLLDSHTFRASDFTETRQGVCRVLAPLTHELAESATVWAQLAGPVVERVAAAMAKSSEGAVRRVSTPITGQSRAAAARRAMQGETAVKRQKASKPRPTCRTCGGPVPRGDYQYCDKCRGARQAEVAKAFTRAGQASFRSRRARGADPTRTEEALAKQRRAMEQRDREAREWREAGGKALDPEIFELRFFPLSKWFPSCGWPRRPACLGTTALKLDAEGMSPTLGTGKLFESS